MHAQSLHPQAPDCSPWSSPPINEEAIASPGRLSVISAPAGAGRGSPIRADLRGRRLQRQAAGRPSRRQSRAGCPRCEGCASPGTSARRLPFLPAWPRPVGTALCGAGLRPPAPAGEDRGHVPPVAAGLPGRGGGQGEPGEGEPLSTPLRPGGSTGPFAAGSTGVDMSRASDFKLLDRQAVDALAGPAGEERLFPGPVLLDRLFHRHGGVRGPAPGGGGVQVVGDAAWCAMPSPTSPPSPPHPSRSSPYWGWWSFWPRWCWGSTPCGRSSPATPWRALPR